MNGESGIAFWFRWVLANSFSEMIGLGGAFLAGYAVITLVNLPEGAASGLALAGTAILLGTGEGAVVGLAQGLVLRRRLAGLRLSRWVSATALGAMLAWTLGMLPSTLMSLGPPPPEGAAPGISESFIYFMAAGLGAVAGPILASAQWIVLRKQIVRAGLWIPANAAAWMVGMPLTFLAADWIQARASTATMAAAVLAAAALTGAIVGAIHGGALVGILKWNPRPEPGAGETTRTPRPA